MKDPAYRERRRVIQRAADRRYRAKRRARLRIATRSPERRPLVIIVQRAAEAAPGASAAYLAGRTGLSVPIVRAALAELRVR